MAAGAVWSSSGKQASRHLGGHNWGAGSGRGLCNAGMPAVAGIQVRGRYPEKPRSLNHFTDCALYQQEGIAWPASRIILW